MPTALVLNAEEMLGNAIVQKLGKHPDTWTTVYAVPALSRASWHQNVRIVNMELLASADKMAKQLCAIKTDYIFFTAVIDGSTVEEDATENVIFLYRFLDALEISGASKTVKRILTTIESARYGLHLGQPKLPMEESDERLAGPYLDPHFGDALEEILACRAEEQGWDWVVIYPSDVIGCTPNTLSAVMVLGIYCAVLKEVKASMFWPGSPAFYMKLTEGNVSNQRFNVHNGGVESWQNLWPKLAEKFNLEIPATMSMERHFDSELDEISEFSANMHLNPPIYIEAPSIGLKDTKHVKRSKLRGCLHLERFSRTPLVTSAWNQLVKRHGLQPNTLRNANWENLQYTIGRNFDVVLSMNKAKRAGWTGWADTWESLAACLDEAVAHRILPIYAGDVEYSSPSDEQMGGSPEPSSGEEMERLIEEKGEFDREMDDVLTQCRENDAKKKREQGLVKKEEGA